jgi:hypothetical protein
VLEATGWFCEFQENLDIEKYEEMVVWYLGEKFD